MESLKQSKLVYSKTSDFVNIYGDVEMGTKIGISKERDGKESIGEMGRGGGGGGG
jgi:hypothetical protein